MSALADILPAAPTLAAFVLASLALNVTPGADMMFTIAAAGAGGPRAGLAAALGINLGVAVHVGMAALGLAALLAASPFAYDLIRYLGAGYLLWLAWSMWRAPPPAPDGGGRTALGRAVMGGFATKILNPKTALFIFAFLPQFADPARAPLGAQIAALGAIFILTGFTVNAAVGALAAAAASRLRAASRLMNRLSALVFGGLAARLVID